jgi:ATP-dependent Clp protease adapter protein ClpS
MMFRFCSFGRGLRAGDFMQDESAAVAGSIRLVFHNDDKTPEEFVISLLRTVFGKSQREASAFTAQINEQGKSACGPYPPAVAEALLEEADLRVRDAGHPLRIASEDAANAPDETQEVAFAYACEALDWHFTGTAPSALVTMLRQFPLHMQADVQVAIDRLFSSPLGFFGIHVEYREELGFAQLLRDGRRAQALAPPQYLDVDVGEATPVKCLRNGLWLCRHAGLRYAAVLSRFREYSPEPVLRIEIAVPAGSVGEIFAERCFSELEAAVRAARSYRGKILSFDGDADYGGRSTGIMVHRLPAVDREQVILPEQTLKLLDRNVLKFVGSRDALRRLGQSTRKGILLYGPPGTGKTHTIRYLAANLSDHTTLIITAEQMAWLSAYMSLARLLQPAMVAIEDVDLIARDRNEMAGHARNRCSTDCSTKWMG